MKYVALALLFLAFFLTVGLSERTDPRDDRPAPDPTFLFDDGAYAAIYRV